MKTLILLLVIIFLVSLAEAKTLRVAVIDTGYSGQTTRLCADGQFDFVFDSPTVGKDRVGHGTKVINAIERYAGKSAYCILAYRVFGDESFLPPVAVAVNYAVAHGATVINLSLEGPTASLEETTAISLALKRGVTVLVAAGNEGKNLDINCNVYPACYHLKGLQVIGSWANVKRAKHGNTGKIITQHEDYCFEGTCGTSLSTAIATGKFLKNKGALP